jgi:hypothetical protein
MGATAVRNLRVLSRAPARPRAVSARAARPRLQFIHLTSDAHRDLFSRDELKPPGDARSFPATENFY